jgi:hypothetical protein
LGTPWLVFQREEGMIAFICKQCRKRHSRPESQAGTLIFCDCGQGNRVPWSSTAPDNGLADAVPASTPLPASPARPRPVPVPAAVPVPSRPPPLPPVVEERKAEPALPSRRPDRSLRKITPDFCLNHDEDKAETTCDACKLPFCNRCVVSLQGKTLCGPCKNFRIAALGRPARTLPLAVVSLVVSLVSGPVTLILSLVGVGLSIGEGATGAAVVLCLVGLALPVAGLVLAGKALRQIDSMPTTAVGGRGLAASGACAALVGVLWCVTVLGLLVFKHLQE